MVVQFTLYAAPSAIINVTLWPLAKLVAVGVRLAPRVHVWIVPLAGLMSTEPLSVIANTVSVKPVNVGVVSVGLVDKTTLPVPVEVVTPVPPEATARVADKPAAVPVVFWFSVGNVQLVNVPDEGVPNAGVTSVGLVDKTTLPVPVEVVTPVPPDATARVADKPAAVPVVF